MSEYNAYEALAPIYDDFMDNISYDTWFSYIHVLLMNNGIKRGTVLDLGCGTGEVTWRLDRAGYESIGLDISSEMLEKAREKCPDTLFIQQDMREMELFGTVEAVVSICDSMNYLVERRDFIEVLKRVNNYLEKDGIFIFDLKTIHFFEKTVGNRVIADNRINATVIWDNEYNEKTYINTSDITLFTRTEGEYYRKSEEVHVQRAYTLEDVQSMIQEAGLELVSLYKAFTGEKATEECDRVYFVLREGFQEGKLYV